MQKPPLIVRRFQITVLVFLFLLPVSGYSFTLFQPSADTAADSSLVVRKIRFAGNKEIKDAQLESLTRTHTNREFLGIPRFTPWYFIWKVTKRFGEPPVYLNREVVGTDINRIETYYKSRGYLDATVDTNITKYAKDKVEVSFMIEPGNAHHIESVIYSGMPDFKNSRKLEDFYQRSKLIRERINDTTFSVDKRFTYDLLTNERNRIITFLKNNGYAAIQRDSVIALVKNDSLNSDRLRVLFRINPGQTYRFGDVHIKLAGPNNSNNFSQRDTLAFETNPHGSSFVFLQKEPESRTDFQLLYDQLKFRPGETFNNSNYVRTINEFQNLGMMTLRQFGLSKDGGLPDYTQDQLPVVFNLQTRPIHQLSMELFGMERYGFGAGAGLTYTNNNLFGRAENLQLGIDGSFEYVSKSILESSRTIDTLATDQLFQSFQASIDYSVPRLNFPFVALEKHPFFSNARTHYSLVYSQSNQINFDINANIRYNLRYEVQHNSKYTSLLDLIELDWLDTTPSTSFIKSLEQQYGQGSLELKRIKEDFRPQFSSLIRYTFRNINTDLIQRHQGHYREYSIAVGGNLPYLLDNYVVTPNTIEGNLPSLFKISGNSLSYTRYFSVSTDYRKYIPLSDESTFAYRFFGGFAHPYGKNKNIPLNRRFFAGGSNDIRGWPPYRIGPGGLSSNQVTINGGEIKLAAFSEIRQRIIRDLISADWIGAFFVDMGNVWYGPQTSFQGTRASQILDQGKFHVDEFYKQIAVSSGLGVRLDWQYVVLRLDFSTRVHDLKEGWFKNDNIYFSFGIGHSF